MRKRLAMAAIFVLIAITAHAGILGYFRDRGADFMDIFLLRVSAARKARGFGFRARATALAQASALYFEGEHFGLDRRGIGVWKERRSQGGLSLLSFSSIENEIVWGNYFLQESPWMNFEERGLVKNDVYWDDGRKHFLSISAEVQPGLLPGVEAGIYPVEIVDFLTGFFTLDPMDDDLARVMKYAPEYQIEEEIPGEEPVPGEWKTLPEDIEGLLQDTQPVTPESSEEPPAPKKEGIVPAEPTYVFTDKPEDTGQPGNEKIRKSYEERENPSKDQSKKIEEKNRPSLTHPAKLVTRDGSDKKQKENEEKDRP